MNSVPQHRETFQQGDEILNDKEKSAKKANGYSVFGAEEIAGTVTKR